MDPGDPVLHQSPFRGFHEDHGAHFVDFAGWEMPIRYGSIKQEHLAVRESGGLFDVSHMGRVRFKGRQSRKFLERILTRKVSDMVEKQCRYAMICNEAGGVLDDVLIYRFADDWLAVVNASNREKILTWIEKHSEHFDASLEDQTQSHFMLAIQGPAAVEVVTKLFPEEIVSLRYYRSMTTEYAGSEALISRTGYTGEDGFEIIVPHEQATALWSELHNQGEQHNLQPAGLGCRDTLRLEAALPLYGHELNEQIDPYTAGLGFAVSLDTGPFIGKQALQRKQSDPKRPRRVGLLVEGRRIAREHAEIYVGANRIGVVTSGTFSPTLEQSIALAYIEPEYAHLGNNCEVDIRGKRQPAQVVKLPFYRRSK